MIQTRAGLFASNHGAALSEYMNVAGRISATLSNVPAASSEISSSTILRPSSGRRAGWRRHRSLELGEVQVEDARHLEGVLGASIPDIGPEGEMTGGGCGVEHAAHSAVRVVDHTARHVLDVEDAFVAPSLFDVVIVGVARPDVSVGRAGFGVQNAPRRGSQAVDMPPHCSGCSPDVAGAVVGYRRVADIKHDRRVPGPENAKDDRSPRMRAISCGRFHAVSIAGVSDRLRFVDCDVADREPEVALRFKHARAIWGCDRSVPRRGPTVEHTQRLFGLPGRQRRRAVRVVVIVGVRGLQSSAPPQSGQRGFSSGSAEDFISFAPVRASFRRVEHGPLAQHFAFREVHG